MQEDRGSFKGLQEFHDMLLGIAAQAAAEDNEGIPLRHLLQGTSLGQVRLASVCLGAPVQTHH